MAMAAEVDYFYHIFIFFFIIKFFKGTKRVRMDAKACVGFPHSYFLRIFPADPGISMTNTPPPTSFHNFAVLFRYYLMWAGHIGRE